MTDEQQAKFTALSYCTFAVGSYPKRFVRNLDGYTGELTEKQADYLDRLVYHYRKQIAAKAFPYVPEARESLHRWIADGGVKAAAHKAKNLGTHWTEAEPVLPATTEPVGPYSKDRDKRLPNTEQLALID